MILALAIGLGAIFVFFLGAAAGMSTWGDPTPKATELNSKMAKYITRVVHWNDTIAPTEYVLMPEELVTDGQKLIDDYKKELKNA